MSNEFDGTMGSGLMASWAVKFILNNKNIKYTNSI